MAKLWAAALLAALAAAGARAGEPPEYELKLPAEVAGEPGRADTVSLTIAPRAGYRIDDDGPLRIDLTVSPPAGLELPRRRYTRRDAADARAEAPRFDLRFLARANGDFRLTVAVRFWICAQKTCRPVRERREVVLAVRPPAPPPSPPTPSP